LVEYTAFGEIAWDSIQRDMRKEAIPKPVICERLLFDIKTRKAICLLQGEQKPDICKRFPFFEEELLSPVCGFRLDIIKNSRY
jgi:hypothetical protein